MNIRTRIALALIGLLAAPAVGLAEEEPASLVLARRVVDACRGTEHAEKMRVLWPEIADETPPDGTEVVIVTGYISYEITRMVFRDGKVEAGSVLAARSWFYNQKEGESFRAWTFDADPDRFVEAWNAARRILGASDERIEPEPKDRRHGGSSSSGSHESTNWIRIRAAAGEPPRHCAARAPRYYNWEDVREWSGLRDHAVFEVFEALIAEEEERPAAVASWAGFVAAEVRAAAQAPDAKAVARDDDLLDTCLRILSVVGGPEAEGAVAALGASLETFDQGDYRIRSLHEEALRTSLRMRIRHHGSRKEIVRQLRAAPDGTWAWDDQAKWLRGVFREKDPEGWAAFLLEETERAEARPADVAAAAADLKDLPAELAVPVLRRLLQRDDPYIRLEAATSLHAFEPEAAAAKAVVVGLALDRSIACEWRDDLTNHWSRIRALEAALDWGGLAPKDLRAHVLAPVEDEPAFLSEAFRRLADTPEAPADAERRAVWLRLLDSPNAGRALGAVVALWSAKDGESRDRMLAALDRIDARVAEVGEDVAGVEARKVAFWREMVKRLGTSENDE